VIPRSTRSRLLSIALVAMFVLAGCGENTRAPAASVGGQDITQAELTAAIPMFEFLSSLSQSPCGQPSEGESEGAACARLTLANLIQQDVLGAYARENDIAVPQERVTSTLDDLESQLGGPAELDKLLKDSGITRDELTALAGQLLLIQEVQKHIGEEQASEEDLRAAYDTNVLQFTQLHARHILLETENEAANVASRATEKNFADLAKQFSTDPSAKQNSGDLGTQPAAGFDPTFSQAALALRPGEISEPVQTQFGWHVILLVSSERQPFEEVRDQLAQQSAGEAFQTWFEQRLTAAEIEVNPRYGRFDPATGLITPINSTREGTSSPSAGAQSQPPTEGGAGAPQP
jgi:foldase protein PrsA